MSRNAQSLSRLRAAFLVFFLPSFAMADLFRFEYQGEALAACQAEADRINAIYEDNPNFDTPRSCLKQSGRYLLGYYLNGNFNGLGKTYHWNTDGDDPNECRTDTIPGGPIMDFSDGIGNNSGAYIVDGCVYNCAANFDKMDGETSYYDSLECVGTGQTADEYEENPGEDAPPNCITDASGKTICEDTDTMGCYEIGGETVCPSQNAVCGEQNGTFNCVEPQEEGCGFFNGEKICYDPEGNKVTDDSPDHPDNGGNLDGDETNDITDPRPEEEGGDPNNQPGNTTGEGGGATEGTAKEGVKQQKIANQKLDGIGDGIGDLESAIDAAVDASRGDGTALKNGIDSAISNAGDSAVSDLDEHIDGIDSPAPMTEGDLGAIENNVTNLFAGSMQCRDLVFGTDEISYTITCNDMSMIRDMLGFLLYGVTVIRLFNVALRPAAKGTP